MSARPFALFTNNTCLRATLLIFLLSVDHTLAGRGGAVSRAEPSVDEKTAQEAVAADDKFLHAILTRDSVTLNQLLSEDYVSSEEGSDWAISKRGTLVRCDAAKLPAYVFEKERRFSRDRQAIVIEGEARVRSANQSEAEEDEERLHVRRWWLKQDGRWILAAQMLPRGASEHEKKTQLN